MRNLAAIVIGFAFACLIAALGVVAVAAFGPIPSGYEETALAKMGLGRLSEVLPLLLLVALPGFVLLRGLLYWYGIGNALGFALAGAINSVFLLSLSMGFLEINPAIALALGSAAGVAQWGLERLVNRGPVVYRLGAV